MFAGHFYWIQLLPTAATSPGMAILGSSVRFYKVEATTILMFPLEFALHINMEKVFSGWVDLEPVLGTLDQWQFCKTNVITSMFLNSETRGPGQNPHEY